MGNTTQTTTGAGNITAAQLQDLHNHFAKFFGMPARKPRKKATIKAILRTYHSETESSDRVVDIDPAHDFAGGPYVDTIPFAVGSNQAILPRD
jgi:hypothetical protein